MIRINIIISTTLRWATYLSCSLFMANQPVFAMIHKENTHIVIDGDIKSGDAAEFVKIQQGVELVILKNITDGESKDFVDIAKTISDKKMNVRIEGICSGDCAILLFLAGNEREISEDGLIAFSAPSTTVTRMLLAGEEAYNAKINDMALSHSLSYRRAELNRIITTQNAVLARSGVDGNALAQVVKLTIPDSKSFMITLRSAETESGVAYHSQFVASAECQYWAPAGFMLTKMGVAVKGGYTRPWSIESRLKSVLVPYKKIYLGSILDNKMIKSKCNRDM